VVANAQLARTLKRLERSGAGVDADSARDLKRRISELNRRLEAVLDEVEEIE